jgi:hypothetical protein
MTALRGAQRAFRIGLLTGVLLTLSGVWTASAQSVSNSVRPPASAAQPPASAARPAALVHLTDVGIVGGASIEASPEVRILVWATGPARIGIAGGDLVPLTDTLRLSSLPTITADVSESDVHIRLLSTGRLRLGGDVTGGRAIHLTATGRHVLLLKGGVGADTVTEP